MANSLDVDPRLRTVTEIIATLSIYSDQFPELKELVSALHVVENYVGWRDFSNKFDPSNCDKILSTCDFLWQSLKLLEISYKKKHRNSLFLQSDLDDYKSTAVMLRDLCRFDLPEMGMENTKYDANLEFFFHCSNQKMHIFSDS